MSALQIVAAVVCLGVTAVAIALLVKAVTGMVATFGLGRPDDYRGDDKAARTPRTLVREFLGHTRMSRLPVVAVAHWFTMVSFGVLFFTLLNAFGQLFAARLRTAAGRALPALRVGHRVLRLGGADRHPRAHRYPSEEPPSVGAGRARPRQPLLRVELVAGLLRRVHDPRRHAVHPGPAGPRVRPRRRRAVPPVSPASARPARCTTRSPGGSERCSPVLRFPPSRTPSSSWPRSRSSSRSRG